MIGSKRITVEVGDGQERCDLLDREIATKRISRHILAALREQRLPRGSGSYSYLECVKWCEDASSDEWTTSQLDAYGGGRASRRGAQIDAVQRRLPQQYAELPHDHVAAVVQRAYARFSRSSLREFVPLLVKRRAREELAKSTVIRPAIAKAGRAVAGSETNRWSHRWVGDTDAEGALIAPNR